MKFDEGTRRAIYAKTDGRCHICHQPLAFSNYNAHGARVAGPVGFWIGAIAGAIVTYEE